MGIKIVCEHNDGPGCGFEFEIEEICKGKPGDWDGYGVQWGSNKWQGRCPNCHQIITKTVVLEE